MATRTRRPGVLYYMIEQAEPLHASEPPSPPPPLLRGAVAVPHLYGFSSPLSLTLSFLLAFILSTTLSFPPVAPLVLLDEDTVPP